MCILFYFLFPADNVPAINSDICDKYTCEIKCPNKTLSSLINRSIEVNLLGQSLASHNENEVVLIFKLLFAPSKAFQYVIYV